MAKTVDVKATMSVKSILIMNFCPICANFLFLQKEASGYKLKCQTCVYYYPLFEQMKQQKAVHSKQQVQIVSTEKDLPIGDAECPRCGHYKAYYEMIQTRSADEQSTIIFECVKCSHKWSVDR